MEVSDSNLKQQLAPSSDHSLMIWKPKSNYKLPFLTWKRNLTRFFQKQEKLFTSQIVVVDWIWFFFLGKKLCILSYTTTENRKLRSGTRISEYLPSPLLFAYWPYFLFYYSEDNFSLNFPWAEVHNIDCWLLEGISPSGAPSLHCKFKTQVQNLGCLNCPAEGIKSSGFRWCGPMNPWAIRIILPSNGPLKSMRMSSQCLPAVGQHTAFQESFWGEE